MHTLILKSWDRRARSDDPALQSRLPAGRKLDSMRSVKPAPLAGYLDSTNLRLDATDADLSALCADARRHEFAAVMLYPGSVPLAAEALAGSPVHVGTVIGFPLGATPKEIKALEARRAIRDGAREVDMVIAVGALKSAFFAAPEDFKYALAESLRQRGEKVAGYPSRKLVPTAQTSVTPRQ